MDADAIPGSGVDSQTRERLDVGIDRDDCRVRPGQPFLANQRAIEIEALRSRRGERPVLGFSGNGGTDAAKQPDPLGEGQRAPGAGPRTQLFDGCVERRDDRGGIGHGARCGTNG